MRKNARNRTILVLASLALLGTAAVAAEPAAPNAPPAEAHGTATPAAPVPAKIDWAKMNLAARKKYMKSTVLPQMKKVFAAFDPKEYSNVTCATCHGKDATDKKFKMPNADLPKLPGPTNRAGFMALAEKKPEVVKFMGTQVKPKMAALLGLAEWTPASPVGFACYNCHTHAEGPGAGAKEAPAPTAAGATKPATTPAPTTAKTAPAPAPAKPDTKGW